MSETPALILFGIRSTNLMNFVLDIQDLVVYFLRGHAVTEQCHSRQVTVVPRIGRTHHVLGVEHLLREFRRRKCAVLLGTVSCERREARMKKWSRWK